MQVLRYLLFPVSLLYAAGVYFRNLLFDVGILKSSKFSTPTIAIGNLTVGGTGKTPMVAYLIELLGSDVKMAVLSRGYKRKSKGFVLANSHSNVVDLGDEPFQIARKYPHITVAVDSNRRNGIRELEKGPAPDIIILDDAYQHRWVKPSKLLLLTSYNALYANDWYLPTGNLRDSKNQAKRANLIIVTKCPQFPNPTKKEELLNSIKPLDNQKVVFGTIQYQDYFIGLNGNLSFQDLKGKNIALVTGIANPAPLVDFLTSKDVMFKHLKFADHHNFTSREIQSFAAYDLVLTTEKDFVRFEDVLTNAYYLEMKHDFSEDDRKVVLQTIQDLIKPAPRPSS
ncbi:MAG: tetraacyldisaccharide 4'-kinase [Allomuricauda sp.]|nr:MAG: tetraacyldisaccharide 4'-kinase [Allomuricauda sp.]